MPKDITCKHCLKINQHHSFQCSLIRKPIKTHNHKESGSLPVIQKLKSKPISPVSDKQKIRLAEYRVVRDKFFKDNPVCQFPECSSTDIQLHHSRGRVGSLLTDAEHFRSLCDKHHRYCELNPIEAKRLGLSGGRL